MCWTKRAAHEAVKHSVKIQGCGATEARGALGEVHSALWFKPKNWLEKRVNSPPLCINFLGRLSSTAIALYLMVNVVGSWIMAVET